ncbi:hypothetical protein, partial [Crossiella equi]|uniref:hypothetical protein n=1 Tax=Crossiella equi TaxID=130796 RepID=UPI0013026B98
GLRALVWERHEQAEGTGQGDYEAFGETDQRFRETCRDAMELTQHFIANPAVRLDVSAAERIGQESRRFAQAGHLFD